MHETHFQVKIDREINQNFYIILYGLIGFDGLYMNFKGYD